MMINQCAADDYSRDQQGRPILRKPADRLGKVVFANEVSIGGVGGGGCPGGPKSRYWNFSGGHVPLGNLVTVGFDSP